MGKKIQIDKNSFPADNKHIKRVSGLLPVKNFESKSLFAGKAFATTGQQYNTNY
ncbi:hypothetical protein [Longitalea luteola]|uniref:hypothetical protein n=1 Tax=Longitalea luteola TaxID=2812563 RepID=UPI001A9618B5|nr:hypothetical protein [Longitalea luteola]